MTTSKKKPATAAQKTPLPLPFLGRVFRPSAQPIIATGYKYHPAEIALHGVATHQAIDFDVPRGTPILAPADGYYVATYGEYLMRNEDGTPRTLSLSDAIVKSGRRRQDIRPPDDSNGPWPVYFGSYAIQGWHGHGRYTQYAHVESVTTAIPYFPPTELKDENDKATGDLAHHLVLRATVTTYRQPAVTTFMQAGTIIGTVGSTGCGWGRRCYDDATLTSDGRPDFTDTNYTHYTEPHVHFMVFGKRTPKKRRPSVIWDPFGIYGQVDAGYPTTDADWHALPGSLWLPQR